MNLRVISVLSCMLALATGVAASANSEKASAGNPDGNPPTQTAACSRLCQGVTGCAVGGKPNACDSTGKLSNKNACIAHKTDPTTWCDHAGATASKPPTKKQSLFDSMDAANLNCVKRCGPPGAEKKAEQMACLQACFPAGSDEVADVVKRINSDRIPGKERSDARYKAGMEQALKNRTLPYDGTESKEQIDALYAKGSMRNPYTGAALAAKPKPSQGFKMSQFEGGGLRRDSSAPDKKDTFQNAKVGKVPKHRVVATFDGMTSTACEVQDPTNPCFFKCLSRYEVGHDRTVTAEAAGKNNGAFEEGQSIRVVPFDYPECECAEGTGAYAGVNKSTTLTFSEATGERTISATYDGAETIMMQFVSLKLLTDVDCSATFKIYDAKNPRPVAKEYGNGRKVMIDFGKLKPAVELQKQMGAKVPEKGTDEATELNTKHTSAYAAVLKKSLAREIARRAANGTTTEAAAGAAAAGDRRRRGKKLPRQRPQLLDAAVSADSTAAEVAVTLPAAYDTRTAFPRCDPIVRNQGSCGSCWTFASSGVLSQRTCIENDGLDQNFVLSPQAMITCDEDCFTPLKEVCNDGCNGGYTTLAFANMVSAGSSPEHCVGYTSGGGTDPETCGNFKTADSVMHSIANCELESDDSDTVVKGDASYDLSGVDEMMTDIYLNGPIQTTLLLENDMYGYTSGIYECDTDAGDLGGHATITVGWGEENGVKYWIVQNSWGADWGDKGFFKIRRGADSCGIESYADAVTAKSGVTFEEGNAIGGGDETGDTPGTSSAATVASSLAIAAAAAAFW